MGAHRSTRSRSVQRDRSRYGNRALKSRSPLPLLIVVCDDERTAVRYFDHVATTFRQSITLRVEKKPDSGADAAAVVRHAIRQKKKILGGVRANSDTRHAVYVLLDLEATAETERQARSAKATAEKAGVIVALSKPCYEVWTLLHLEDTGALFADCDAVLQQLRAAWEREFGQKMPPKTRADYSKISPRWSDACGRAKRQRLAMAQSWTEVDLVFDAINMLIRQDGNSTPTP